MLMHAVSSKVQGTVKVRKFMEIQNNRNLNSTRILIFNPGEGRRRPSSRGREMPGAHGQEQREVPGAEGGGLCLFMFILTFRSNFG